ncbi:GNAT domain-containing protein [Armillaria luteobubalina]|uniref:GNAT domain-containing protein n=1 Tax=Armillaria luteobubalina TaxID=153913 RepID=A0AA39PT42_9AGAR|nr:GNAT domain-containing protein [Armillaria luteobubalina]KAK0490037.1 GNAT domain-containing protein [Armillaria luteobubalina]
MKVNESTVLIGRKVVLVPYDEGHVSKYHSWMENDELRSLTASDRLTLEEEFDMQRKWREDDDKLTFIILARHERDLLLDDKTNVMLSDPRIRSLPMAGDVNMFLNGAPEDEDEFTAEVEIMIAEPDYRRGGLALEALQLMLQYATENKFLTEGSSVPTVFPTSSPLPVPPSSLVARIGDTNLPSIRLFEKLGFVITKRIEVFSEVEMKLG